MAWTAARTWTPGEVLTAAHMNTYVRDNTQAIRWLQQDGRATWGTTQQRWDSLTASSPTLLYTEAAKPGPDFPYRMYVHMQVVYGFNAAANQIAFYLESPQGAGIAQGTGNVDFMGQRAPGFFQTAYIQGWRDLAASASWTWSFGYAINGGSNSYIRMSAITHLVARTETL